MPSICDVFGLAQVCVRGAAGAVVSLTPRRRIVHLEAMPRESAADGNRRIRVLEVIGTMHIGGAEQVVTEIVRGLDRQRFDVALCCTRELGVLAESLTTEHFDVSLASPSSRRLRHFTPLYLLRQIRRFKPHVVHSHGTPSLLHAAPLATVGLLPPWVHTFHFGNYGPGVEGKMMVAERWFCRAATQLIAVSDSQRDSIERYHGLPAGSMMTVLNGVPPTPSLDTQAIIRRRSELGFTETDVIVGCVAVLSRQKGVTYLLQAAGPMMQRDPRIRLLIVGGGPNENALREEAKALGIASRVVFTGWRNDATSFLPLLDVFVMSSLWEAMPMALLEAMAAGRPIVVTDVADNRAIVDGGRCAMVVPPKDPQAIADAVTALTLRPADARELGEKAGRRFQERYTTRHMIAAYERIFERYGAH